MTEHRDIIDIRLPAKRQEPVEHEHPPPCSRSFITEIGLAIYFLVALGLMVLVMVPGR